MMLRALIAAAALFAVPATAAPQIRALFVGINNYRNVGPDLENLTGSVADVALIKAVLKTRYGVAVDAPGDGCRTTSAMSVTLVNECATRAAILADLDAQIAASKPGDTLIFYYSGHGATTADQSGTQAGGVSGTLVPHDARSRGVPDIRDTHFDAVIDAATARGVNVLSIFDACHSGTATRDLRRVRVRSAKANPTPAPPVPKVAAGPRAATPGYRVHFGAAADTEAAREVELAGGKWEGAFTTALAKAIAGAATPTYADVIAEVRRSIVGTSQTPQAEGALTTPFLGVRVPPVRLFAAERLASGDVAFAGGIIAGVTTGSTYGVFATVADAVRNAAVPLATGVVTRVGAGDATLKLAKSPQMPAKFHVRELIHVYGGDILRLRLDNNLDLADTLAGLDLVEVAPTDPRLVLRRQSGGVALFAVDGTPVGSVLDPAAPDFKARLRETLRRVANADALLSLRGDSGAALGSVAVRRACADPADCVPLAVTGGETVVAAGDAIIVEVANTTTDKTLYPYAFYVDADHGILTLMPPPGARDPPLGPLETRSARRIRTGGTGRDHIVLVMSDTPIDLASLEQEAVRDVLPPPKSDLERLLRAARSGQSSRDIPRVGNWGATAFPLRRVAP